MNAELIERLEKAAGPDRDLDSDIAVAVASYPPDFQRERTPGRRWLWIKAVGGSTPEFDSWEAPAYTSSFDAALTLAPEAANCHGYDAEPGLVEAYFSRNNVESGHWLIQGTHKSSVAIALCIAALRARADR